jgi:hypothetical protein
LLVLLLFITQGVWADDDVESGDDGEAGSVDDAPATDDAVPEDDAEAGAPKVATPGFLSGGKARISIESISPAHGPITGDTRVTVRGGPFKDAEA